MDLQARMPQNEVATPHVYDEATVPDIVGPVQNSATLPIQYSRSVNSAWMNDATILNRVNNIIHSFVPEAGRHSIFGRLPERTEWIAPGLSKPGAACR
ncbi:hypothetical protein FOMPIDRAFT_1056878 [Fomitopsis schrenkii]|uniref:Uncharacterized protein n=1 Tax=Fomitopsis schrenkii TaxID=2126942 RepID=S8F058_FOMSC|nr:hypothetical protein FOMPIDRAFT_1056878 [Fomitopsis schrenkii]